MKSCRPKAYILALSLRPKLFDKFNDVKERLLRNGFKNRLIAFETLIRDCKASINMSIPKCNDFLKYGRWLNINEFVFIKKGKTGADLEKEIKSYLGKWYTSRRTIDKLFRFRRDTHYASINLGGIGPQRYGACCVVFDLSNWTPYYTCYGGDSIRACFDSKGNKVLADDAILEHFGVGQDVYQIATVRHKRYLREKKPGINISELQAILESTDSLIEFHHHGSVIREHIAQVIMSHAQITHYWELAERSSAKPKPWPQEYDVVPFFLEMIKLLDFYNIPLILKEG